MKMFDQSERLNYKVVTANETPLVLDFYNENKPYFEPWEGSRPLNFYTEAYQRATLTAEYNHLLQSDFIRYYIFYKEDPNQILGTISLSNISYGIFQCCNLGYKIDHNFHRKGLATEAINWIISLAFCELKLHRIEAMVHINNIPSQRLLEKIGFHSEGIAIDYALLREGWSNHIRYVLLSS